MLKEGTTGPAGLLAHGEQDRIDGVENWRNEALSSTSWEPVECELAEGAALNSLRYNALIKFGFLFFRVGGGHLPCG